MFVCDDGGEEELRTRWRQHDNCWKTDCWCLSCMSASLPYICFLKGSLTFFDLCWNKWKASAVTNQTPASNSCEWDFFKAVNLLVLFMGNDTIVGIIMTQLAILFLSLICLRSTLFFCCVLTQLAQTNCCSLVHTHNFWSFGKSKS